MRRIVGLALVTASLVAAVGTAPGSGQSPSPGPSASTAPSGIASGPCGIDVEDVRVEVGAWALGLQGGPAFVWRFEDPTPERQARTMELVAGEDIPIRIRHIDAASEEVIPVDTVTAILTIDGQPAVWLDSDISADGLAIIRTGLDSHGDGELSVRVGLCDDWSVATYGPVVVVEPSAIRDCPGGDVDGQAYVDGLDQRVRVGHSMVPSLGILTAIARFTDPPSVGSPSYVGFAYRPADRPIRVRVEAELHVRPVDRDLTLVTPSVRWLDVPPARQLRDGFVTSFEGRRKMPHTRHDAANGYYVRAPSTPGQYLLMDSSRWQNHCIRTGDYAMLAIVEVR